MLGATPTSDVLMKCGDVPMYTGRMGRQGNSIAVQVLDKTGTEQTE